LFDFKISDFEPAPIFLVKTSIKLPGPVGPRVFLLYTCYPTCETIAVPFKSLSLASLLRPYVCAFSKTAIAVISGLLPFYACIP